MVVVGSGAAGIAVALTAAATGLRVLVLTKDLVGGATPLAQGGLAAALGTGDTPASHAADTLVAGAGLCAPEVVAALADSAPGAIGWLTGLGARLETSDLRLEGGHSARRIVHSGDDATGAEVHRTLLAALLSSGVEILDRTVALDLLLRETGDSRETHGAMGADGANGVGAPSGAAGTGQAFTDGRSFTDGGIDRAGTSAGARAADRTAAANADPAGALTGELVPARPDGATRQVDAESAGAGAGERAVAGLLAGAIGADGSLTPGAISARAVVIAAGGLGQAFGTTSNPAGATGDGIAIAARAGAVIRDLEFVQFHPTVLWLPDASGQCPLVTEALRGAGAVLRDLDGTPLMAGHDPRGDLAPRDVVAARMAEAIGAARAGAGAAAGAGHVWLDATQLGRELLEGGFPTVTAACRKHGIDPVTDLIPVAPGAHYSCGGIRADLDGRTNIPGLYAAGEAASTGVQGANRLASNSVTEAIIAGRRTGTACGAWVESDERDERDARHRNRSGLAAPEAIDVPAPGHTRPEYSGPVGHKDTSSSLVAHAASTFQPGGTQDRNEAAAGPAANQPLLSRARHEAGRRALAQAMSRYAGVMRDADGLSKLLRIIAEADVPAGSTTRPAMAEASESADEPGGFELAEVEAANLRTVSLLIAAGALRRAESRGCHRRRDAAQTAATPWHTLARWDGHELLLSEEAL